MLHNFLAINQEQVVTNNEHTHDSETLFTLISK